MPICDLVNFCLCIRYRYLASGCPNENVYIYGYTSHTRVFCHVTLTHVTNNLGFNNILILSRDMLFK